MPKIEKVEKEICMQVRKTRCNMATTGKEKVVDKLIGKWKGNSIIIEIFEKNRNKRKKMSKRKKVGIS